METMTAVDKKAYAKILSSKIPHVIENEAEYEQFLAEAQSLVRRELSAAEDQFLDLLTLLIEKYEDERFPTAAVEPATIIRELMAAQGVSQSDVAEVIGSKGNASEILAGKREVSKAQARKLGALFRVPPHLFLGL